MKCKKCGAEIQEGYLFCGACGERKEEEPKQSFKEIVNSKVVTNDISISFNLKAIIILAVCLFALSSLFRLAFPDMDWEDVISFIQWGRFFVVAFAFFGFSTVLFDRESSKNTRMFTVLCIVTLVIVTFYFLLPEIPASSLWDKILS